MTLAILFVIALCVVLFKPLLTTLAVFALAVHIWGRLDGRKPRRKYKAG